MLTREQTLHTWLHEILPQTAFDLTPMKGDASFRRYFRLQYEKQSFIVMDAPPHQESLQAFLAVQQLLKTAGICVPDCIHVNQQEGFILLSDFGDQLFFHVLTAPTLNTYQHAIDILIQLQSISATLPAFDTAHLLKELSLFPEWFLEAHLNLQLTTLERQLVENTFLFLANALAQQPRVVIHRDYHSRNLMCLPDQTLGVLDFQDAMQGPLTYDLVSLLKDCYHECPLPVREQCLAYYHAQSPLTRGLAFETLQQYLEECGLQRHLKVLGIFARLAKRDGKSGYLENLPLTLQYVMNALAAHPNLQEFHRFMQLRVHLP